jgi:hypothetical protein
MQFFGWICVICRHAVLHVKLHVKFTDMQFDVQLTCSS